jgi:glycosyltransferase involved in cell wall biosynthesis
MHPTISIIMPSYQQAKYIEKSLRSILAQNYEQIEIVVADGSSVDGSVEILERMAKGHPNLSFLSEPDNGPADALNKALAKSGGTIFGWLNSDDIYSPNIFSKIVAFFDEHPEKVMVYGQGLYIDESDNELGHYPTQKPNVGLRAFAKNCFICQPTVFFKSSMYTLLGPLDTSLKTSFDYEYWMRAFHNFPDRIGFIDEVLAKSRLHKDCITLNDRRTIAAEGAKLAHKYFGVSGIHWFVTYLEELRNSSDMPMGELREKFISFDTEFGHLFQSDDILALRKTFNVAP